MPPCRHDRPRVLAAARHGLAPLDGKETDQIFCLNAIEVYRLDL